MARLPPTRLEQIESVFSLIARMVAFVLGCAVIAYHVFSGQSELWVLVTGAALCGPTVAAGFATILEAVRGGPADPGPPAAPPAIPSPADPPAADAP